MIDFYHFPIKFKSICALLLELSPLFRHLLALSLLLPAKRRSYCHITDLFIESYCGIFCMENDIPSIHR